MTVVIITIMILGISFGFVAYLFYRKALRRAKNIERGLKMVPLLIHLPPRSSDTEAGARDVREVMREKVGQAQVLYNMIAGTATEGFKSRFYGQRHIALEMVASAGMIHFYAAVPVALVEVVSNAIQTAYPGAQIEESEDHNLFNPQSKLTGTTGGELVLKTKSAYPIATIDKLERDPIEALINSLSDLKLGEGVGVQIMLRPAGKAWVSKSLAMVKHMRHNAGSKAQNSYNKRDILMAAVKAPEERRQEIATNSPQAAYMSDLEQSVVKAIEEKTTLAGYEVLIRVIVSGNSAQEAQNLLREVTASFSLFDAPGLNGFKFLPASDMAGLVTAFILRYFPPELNHTILNSQELASLFHLPDAQFTPNAEVERQTSKQVDGPVKVSSSGLLFGYNFFRGTKKEIRLSGEDRRRHTYIVGQTGTGKSTILQNLAVQDMLAGNGFCFIDPHGDEAEKMLSMVPKNRAEDVVYFNPGDTEHPLGLNIFEFSDPAQKDFLIQESINMLYKIYDPGKTGIIGPRFEQWYRNAALTIMADPSGASFIEIPKVFTDTDYLKSKFKYLTDPTVIEFWTKEMAQTSDYHKSEMLGWFASKFGAFQQNELMRNVIGQTKSAFNFRDIMDNKKILIVNLSKGKLGDLNSQLLGIILVIKFQAAAMSRANVPEAERPDFCLYVDEFQNFSTDSFASILSEARKYHLNLIVANQFIGQLTDEIRDAVFGNVGTMMSYRTGPEDAEFLVKQFAPVFDAHDLINIPNHNAVLKLMIGGLPSQPFSITALPPLGVENPQLGEAMKQLSAAKFGVNRAQVEQEIFARLSGKPLVPPSLVAPPVAVSSPAPLPSAAPLTDVPAAPIVPAPLDVAVVPTPAPVSVAPVSPSTPVPIISAVNNGDASVGPALAASVSALPEPLPTLAGVPEPLAAPVPVAAPVASSAVLDIKPLIPEAPIPQPSVPTIAALPLPEVAKIIDPPALQPLQTSNNPSILPLQGPPLPPTPTVAAEPDVSVFHVPVDPSQELADYAAEVYPTLELPKFDLPQEKPRPPIPVPPAPLPVAPLPSLPPISATESVPVAPPVPALPVVTSQAPPLPITPTTESTLPPKPPQAEIVKHSKLPTQVTQPPSNVTQSARVVITPPPPKQWSPPAQLPTPPPPAQAALVTAPSISVAPKNDLVQPTVAPASVIPRPEVKAEPVKPLAALPNNKPAQDIGYKSVLPQSVPTQNAPIKPNIAKELGHEPPALEPISNLNKFNKPPTPTDTVSKKPEPGPVNPDSRPPSLEPIAILGVVNKPEESQKASEKPALEEPKPLKPQTVVLPQPKPEAKPESNIFQPDPKAQQQKTDSPPVEVASVAKPVVAAGEIYVDDDGNIVQG